MSTERSQKQKPKGNIVQKKYDKVGRLLKVTADGRTTTYEYYADGSRKKVIHPDNSTSEYEYDTAGLLNVLRNKRSNGTVMDSYTYTYDAARNQTAKVEVINGVTKGRTDYLYNSLNILQRITEPGGRVTNYTTQQTFGDYIRSKTDAWKRRTCYFSSRED